GLCKFFGKSPKLASPRNRRMVVEEHAVRVTTLAALEGDGNDLSALRVIAETSRIRHADKFIFDQRLVHLQRFRDDLAKLLRIGSIGNDQILAINEAVRANRIRRVRDGHRKSSAANLIFFHRGLLVSARLKSSDRLDHALVRLDFRKIESTNALHPIGKLQNLTMAERPNGVVVSGAPMLLHRPARELKIFDDAFIALAVVNQLNDVTNLVISLLFKSFHIFIRVQALWKLLYEARERKTKLLLPLVLVGRRSGAARVLDILEPHIDLSHVARHLTTRAPEVNLKRESINAGPG